MSASTAHWFMNNHIIYIYNVGEITADDFRQVDQEIIAMMKDAQSNGIEKTHIVFDCNAIQNLPSVTELEGGRILKYFAEPNCGWTMIVGYRDNPALIVMFRLLTSIMNAQLHLASTLTNATTQIRRKEPHLDELVDMELWKKETITVTHHK